MEQRASISIAGAKPLLHLDTLKLKNVMTIVPITVDEDMDVPTARKILRDGNIRHLPVMHRGKLRGILSERDTRNTILLPDLTQISVADIMTKNPFTLSEETPILDVILSMAGNKFGCILATGAQGKVSGIFTTDDALRLILREAGHEIPAPTSWPTSEYYDSMEAGDIDDDFG